MFTIVVLSYKEMPPVFLTLSTPSRSKVPRSPSILEKYRVLHFEKKTKYPQSTLENKNVLCLISHAIIIKLFRILLFMFRHVLLVAGAENFSLFNSNSFSILHLDLDFSNTYLIHLFWFHNYLFFDLFSSNS